MAGLKKETIGMLSNKKRKDIERAMRKPRTAIRLSNFFLVSDLEHADPIRRKKYSVLGKSFSSISHCKTKSNLVFLSFSPLQEKSGGNRANR